MDWKVDPAIERTKSQVSRAVQNIPLGTIRQQQLVVGDSMEHALMYLDVCSLRPWSKSIMDSSLGIRGGARLKDVVVFQGWSKAPEFVVGVAEKPDVRPPGGSGCQLVLPP
jgi:hypothetical protein